MNIYLIGFMGSGKSHFGSRLASKLGFQFLDLDKRIEKRAGESIAELINTKGIRNFRRIERDVLMSTIKEGIEKTVIATGGGTPCHYQNLKAMKSHGKVVYLDTKWNVIVERLKKTSSEFEKRPLLSPNNEKSWKELYIKRESKYRQAHIICDLSALHSLDLLTNSLDLLTKV
jgi:shikimate kinase